MSWKRNAWRRWLAGSIRKASGTSKTSATSNASSASARGGVEQADDRRDRVGRDGRVDRQPADDLDLVRLRGPLPRAPSRSAVAIGVGVFRVGAAAGEADLAGVVVEVVGAARQQHRQAAGTSHERDQHGGVAHRAIDEALAVADELGHPGRLVARAVGLVRRSVVARSGRAARRARGGRRARPAGGYRCRSRAARCGSRTGRRFTGAGAADGSGEGSEEDIQRQRASAAFGGSLDCGARARLAPAFRASTRLPTCDQLLCISLSPLQTYLSHGSMVGDHAMRQNPRVITSTPDRLEAIGPRGEACIIVRFETQLPNGTTQLTHALASGAAH